mgnify:CR=1 FL=1
MIYNTAAQNTIEVKRIGLNVQILKDSTDLNNVRYLVKYVKPVNNKTLVANCGNYESALNFAQAC